MERRLMAISIETQRIEVLDLAKIRVDGGTQARVHLDDTVIREYTELMEAGVEFPPLRTWFDGEHYWLSDGFHRVAAATRSGKQQLTAEVLCGTLEEARWDSYRVNASHGLRRTKADIREIVKKALGHPQALRMSSNQIARHLCLPEATFRRWRKHLSSSCDEDTVRMAVRGRTVYQIETVKIGKSGVEASGRPRSRKRLEQDLDEMRASATPHTQRLLNICSGSA